MIDAKKFASEEFTACSDPANEESMVSMSFNHVSVWEIQDGSMRRTNLSETVEHATCRAYS
jgi:hypothetical protein